VGSNRLSRNRSIGSYLNYLDEKSRYSEYRTEYSNSIAANAVSESALAEELEIIQKAIQSGNYIAGEAGWRISGNGDAEFGSVVVRGDITAYAGAIGYWNISSPAVTRVIGSTTLLGTFLESSGFGDNDEDVTSGSYVALFKSYSPDPYDVTRKSRTSNVATLTIEGHDILVGDYIIVGLEDDTTFNSNGEKVQVTDVDYRTISYSNTGTDVADSESQGYVTFYNKDVAGLYLRDYSKSEFDYGYFSNTGVAYVSAEDVNLLENPSFEYINSGGSRIASTSSWTAGAGITFATEQFNDGGVGPQYQYDSNYGGRAIWSSALSTYLSGKLDYTVGDQYNLYDFGRVLYLGLTVFPRYTSTRSVPTSVSRYAGPGGALYWQIDTSGAHGLSGGDTVLLDFDGVQFDSLLGEYLGRITRKNVTGGYTRTQTVLSSPAPSSTTFYIDSGYTTTDTLEDNVTLVAVDEIRNPNTTVDLGDDGYGTRSAYIYTVTNAAFNLSDIRLRFGNGSTVNLYDVLSVETKALWDAGTGKYLISDPILYSLGYHDAAIGIPYMEKSNSIIIDANKLAIKYKTLDSTNYASKADIYIDIPGWMYTHNGAGYVSGSPTKITSFSYLIDNLYVSTTNKSFFGGSLPNIRWYSTTDLVPSYDPAQASIEGTKQWINVDLDTQTASLDYFNYVGFKQSNFSRSMLVSPNVTTSDSLASKVVLPTDYETLTVTSGTYRYINNGGDYVDLVSSLKTITGDRDSGFELIANKKYHSGLTDYVFAEEYALIAGYWDESSSQSVVQIKSKKFVVSGGGYTDVNTDRLTVTSAGVVVAGTLTVNGNTIINGTTTTVNSTTITVDDKNIELASTASPSDALADGAGITVKGTAPDKTWNWYNATDAWTSNQDIDIVSPGTSYDIAGTSVLTATTLGSSVVNSSLTKVGALSGGTAGFVKVDASGNLTSTTSSASLTALTGFTTTVTSGTPVVLTNSSTYYQQFTGSTAQTITLPVTSTLALGWTFHIVNNSTANLTVNSSGGNLVFTIIPGTTAMVTCIATAGTGAANWEAGLTDFSTYTGTGDVVLATSPTISTSLTLNATGGSTPYLNLPGTTTLGYQGNKEINIRNLNQLRFESGNNWNYNSWAGIGFDSTTRNLYLGGPAGSASYFSFNSDPERVIFNLVGLSTFNSDAKNTVLESRGTNTRLIVKAKTRTATVSNVSGNGTTVTYTTSTAHYMDAGDVVTITGVNPGAYNLTSVTIATVPSQTTFTVTNAATGAFVSGGTATVTQANNLQEWQNASGTVIANISPQGGVRATGTLQGATISAVSDGSTVATLASLKNIQLGGGSASLGGGSGVIGISNATTVPASLPTGGGILYVDTGALKYLGTSGSAQNIVSADGTINFTGDVSATGGLYPGKTAYGFSVSSGAPASTTYWKIATLPISTAGTFDHIIVDAVLDDNWGSVAKARARVLLSNRNAFTYRYYLEGTVRVSARIVTYTETNGSVSVYLQASSGQYTTFSYNITHGIDSSTIIYKNPASTTTAPTGTLSFDSGVIATYVPEMYIPYTGQPIIRGLVSSTGVVSGTSFVKSGGTSSQFLKADGSSDSNLYLATNTSSNLYGSSYFAGHNPEGRFMYNAYLANDMANARLRGSTVSATQNGVSYSISNANWDAMFDGTASFFNISPTSGFTFPLVITVPLPRTLTYGTWVGLSFGSSTFRANSVTIEVFSLDSSSWVTVFTTTTNTSEDIFAAVSGLTNGNATGINQIRYTISSPNSTQLRIQHLWAYNFNSDMWSTSMMPRAGGSFYGPVTNTTSNSGQTPLIVKAPLTPTVDVFQIQNSGGSPQVRVDTSFYAWSVGWVLNGSLGSFEAAFGGALAARTGTAGVEEGLIDNMSSTGSTAGAQFIGAGGVNTIGRIITSTTTSGFGVSSTPTAWGGFTPTVEIRGSSSSIVGINFFMNGGPFIRAYDGSGNARGAWAADGSVVVGQSNTKLGTLSVYTDASGTVGLVVRGATSQSADLQRWQNNAATPETLSKVDYLGRMYIPGGTTIYDYAVESAGATDTAWKKLIEVTAPTGLYTGASYQVDVVDNFDNYGIAGSSNTPQTFKFYVKITRSMGTQDDVLAAVVLGPSVNYVRVVKTSSSLYEIQVRQPDVYRVVSFKVRKIVQNNTTESYTPSGKTYLGLDAGSTTGTIYVPVNDSATFSNFVVENFSQLSSNRLFVQPITGSTNATVPVTIRGASGQTGNLQDWQSWNGSTATTLASIDSSGRFNSTTAGNFGGISVGLAFLGVQTSANTWGLAVRGGALQVNHLSVLLNSSGTTLGGVNANGQLFSGSAQPLTTSTGGATTATSGTGSVATITTTSNHNLASGDRVTVAGVTPTGYNGTYIVTGTPTTTSFTYNNATTGAQTVAGTVAIDAQASIVARSAATTPFILRAAVNQGVNMLRIEGSGGSAVITMDAAGGAFFAGTITHNGFYQNFNNMLTSGNMTIGLNSSASGVQLGVYSTSTTNVGAIIRGANGQTADLQQWQTWNGTTATTVALVTSAGALTLKPVANAANQSRGILLSNTSDLWQSGLYLKSDGSGNPRLTLLAPTGALGEAISIDAAAKVGIGNTAPIAQLDVYSQLSTRIGVVIRGAASQSADLLVGQDNSGNTTLFSVASSGALFTNSTLFTTAQTYVYGAADYGAALNVQTRATGSQGIIVRGRSGQTVNLQEWQTSAPSTVASVSQTGKGTFDVLNAPNGAFFGNLTAQPGNGAYLAVQAYSSAQRPFMVRGFGAITANLVDYQDGSAAIVGGRSGVGQIFTGSIAPLTTSTGGATTATSGDGTTATITTTNNHNLAVGDIVTVAGITPTGYNGTFSVASTPTTTSFTYANTTTGSQTVAGTVRVYAQASSVSRSAATVGLIVRAAASQVTDIQQWQISDGTVRAYITADGSFLTSSTLTTMGNLRVAGTAGTGGGSGVIGIANAGTVPSSNPSGGGVLFVESGALKYRGTSSSARTIVNADGTDPNPLDGTTSTAAAGAGFMGLPQNSTTTGSYTIVAADAGKHIYASATRTVTINSNTNLALPIGTTLTFIAGSGATMTIAITSDTMYLAGTGTTGSRTLAPFGMATAVKITSTSWIISGNGLT